MRALLAPYDKTGLVDLARGLLELGVEIFSTGGTEETLKGAGLAVRPVQDITGFPEMLGGRVKTLHPAIHAGILARRGEPHDMEEMEQHGFQPIDIVVCNLYPFVQTIQAPDVTREAAIENIDIGGVTLLRAAAKNYEDVVVVCDPTDYPALMDELRRPSGELFPRRRLPGNYYPNGSSCIWHADAERTATSHDVNGLPVAIVPFRFKCLHGQSRGCFGNADLDPRRERQ